MSNGIDFVIGGTDKAGPAMDKAEKSLARLEQKADSVGMATKRLAAVTGVLAVGYAAVKGALAALGGLDKINAAYDQQADAVKGLEAALKIQGAAVDKESTKLQSFAGDMQKLTGVGDEVTLGLMKQAGMLGVNSEQLDDVSKAAIGLSEATGKSLDESLKLVTNSLHGEFGAFGEIIPQIKNMTSQEERLAAVLKLSKDGLDAKAETSNTVSGMSERAAGAIGDLMESVGALIAPVRILVSQGLKVLAESLQTVLAPAVEYAKSVLENIGPAMDWVKEKVVAGVNLIIKAFTFFEVIITNLDNIWVAMVSQAELYMLQFTGSIMHALTVVIPEYASWFARNFVNIISDAFQAVVTVITNAGQAIGESVYAIFDFIRSGMTGGLDGLMGELSSIASRSLLEGFESSIESLPEIAARKITEREKDLAQTVGQIGANLGEEFATKFADRMITIGDDLAISTDIDLNLNKKGNKSMTENQVSQSRLLTRGPTDPRQTALDKIAKKVEEIAASTKSTDAAAMEAASNTAQIATNTSQSTTLVPVQ